MTDDDKKELQDAIRILKSDGFHIHRTAEAYAKTREKPADDPKPEDPKPEDDPKPADKEEGGPPPVKDKPADPPKSRDWWFGSRGHE